MQHPKKIVSTCALSLALLLSGCATPWTSENHQAENLVEDYYASISSGKELKDIFQYFHVDEEQKEQIIQDRDIKEKATHLITEDKKWIEKNNGISNIRILEKTKLSENDYAEKYEAKLQITYRNGVINTSQTQLIKVNGEWKMSHIPSRAMGTSEKGDPQQIAQLINDHYHAIAKNDIKTYNNTQLGAQAFAEKQDSAFSQASAFIKENGGIAKIDVVYQGLRDKDSTILVEVMITFQNGKSKRERLKVADLNGQWKIHQHVQ